MTRADLAEAENGYDGEEIGMTAFRLYALTLFFFAVAAVFTDPVQGQEKKPPYWASLSKDEARMRAGPSMEIGRASCRERGGQNVLISGVAVSLKKKRKRSKP